MEYLTKKEKDVINCFIKNIEKSELPVYEISLFGSKARGDFNENSDIDILILAYGKQNMHIMDIILDVGFESMLEVLGEDEAIPFRKVIFFEEELVKSKEFIDNIQKDKIILWQK